MIWAVLAVVLSAPPPAVVGQRVASTYDEAACAEAQAERPEIPEINCSEPPPAIPAVLDCNDARMSVWLGEMIGSCEMPRTQPTGAVKAASNGDPKICRDGRCSVDSSPLRATARFFDDSIPALRGTGSSLWFDHSVPLPPEAERRLARLDGKRLERPPRSL